MYKNFLFDLDGTLLPMDMKYFIELYVAAFCKCLAPVTKIESKPLMDSIWASVAQMARNDGDCLNETIFWRTMNSRCKRDMRVFIQPLAKVVVDYIKKRGGRIIVATNPIFPKSSTYTRIEWAGLNVNDFSYITTYDNSSACKPNLNYFEEVCSVCGIHPEESLMIGNDVDEDMISSRLGFDTFLVTDCLINRSDKSLSLFRHGDFEDLFDFIQDSYK